MFRLITAGTVEERMYEKQVHKDGIRRALLSNSGSATERYFTKDQLRRLFQLSAEGECSMLQILGAEPHMFDDLDVVGVSSHDQLYVEKVIDVEKDRELLSPFSGTPAKPTYKIGKAGKLLIYDCGNNSDHLGRSKNSPDMSSIFGGRSALISSPTKFQNRLKICSKVNASADELGSKADNTNEGSSVISREVANSEDRDRRRTTDAELESTQNETFYYLLVELQSLDGKENLEKKMAVLLDMLNLANVTHKEHKLQIHEDIATTAKHLGWL